MGSARIHGELRTLGVDVSERTASRLLTGLTRPPSQTWRTFLTNHLAAFASMDFFTVWTLTGRVLFAVVVLSHHRRRIVHLNTTAHPTAEWAAQQVVEAFPDASAPGWIHRDPWAAALVAQHAITVCDRHRADTAWAPFFTPMEVLRGGWMRAAGWPLDDLLADYAFVRLADPISLVFCTGWPDAQRFDDWTVQHSGVRVLLSPDPFCGATIPITIAARPIPRQRFEHDADLHQALTLAHTVTLRGEAAG